MHRTVNEIPRDTALNIPLCGNDSQSCSSYCSCCHTGSRHNGSCRNLDNRCNIGIGSNFDTGLDTHSCMILFTYIINKSLKKINKLKRIKRPTPQPAPPPKKKKQNKKQNITQKIDTNIKQKKNKDVNKISKLS